mmetsp:Transcript_61360/g.132790  ORF Transcript_61360/g.132790 Transcript_61360/m.132790 type:complete len:250 (-) Transcript_61360:338-1087(-)
MTCPSSRPLTARAPMQSIANDDTTGFVSSTVMEATAFQSCKMLPVAMSHARTCPFLSPPKALLPIQSAATEKNVTPPSKTWRHCNLSRSHSLAVRSPDPLRASSRFQSTSRLQTSSLWPSSTARQLRASKFQRCSRPSKEPVSARMLSQCAAMDKTTAVVSAPNSPKNSPSWRFHILRPPSLAPDSDRRSRGSRVARTRCNVPRDGTPHSSSVESFGMASAHQKSCCEAAGTPTVTSRRFFKDQTLSVG